MFIEVAFYSSTWISYSTISTSHFIFTYAGLNCTQDTCESSSKDVAIRYEKYGYAFLSTLKSAIHVRGTWIDGSNLANIATHDAAIFQRPAL